MRKKDVFDRNAEIILTRAMEIYETDPQKAFDMVATCLRAECAVALKRALQGGLMKCPACGKQGQLLEELRAIDQERHRHFRDAVIHAIERSEKSAPKERDNISRNTLVEDLQRALLKWE